jgi:hypothetical protein
MLHNLSGVSIFPLVLIFQYFHNFKNDLRGWIGKGMRPLSLLKPCKRPDPTKNAKTVTITNKKFISTQIFFIVTAQSITTEI